MARADADPSLVFDAVRRDASEHHEHAVVVADFLDEMKERMSLLIPEADADPYRDLPRRRPRDKNGPELIAPSGLANGRVGRVHRACRLRGGDLR